ncbi:GerAB/ArcD/ProY family transporter [Clostridiisalibacter paucivorans]|uniref:GerAB/ArcD/ProY family transporter n=1 Tax=Clostridiisalibacter paucivorans TaxID=408753 RepID=UPI000479ED4C|nr:endospore germination permease [Clostridiisalibacter paucivorans]
MIGKDNITKGQNAAIMVGLTLGVGILSLPSNLINKVGKDGWILIILGGIMTSIMVVVLTKLNNMYRGEDINQYAVHILKKPLGKIISIIYILYYLGLLAFVMRIFAEVTEMFLLINTPTEFIIITMLLATSYIARMGIEPIGRIVQIIIPIVVIPIFLLLLTLLPELHFDNILPICRCDFKEILFTLPTIFFSFLGFEIIAINNGFMLKEQQSIKTNVYAVLTITAIYMFTFLITIMKFGEEKLDHLLWPSLSIMKTIDIPGAFIENIEGIVMSLWMLMIFATVAPVLFAVAFSFSRLFNCKKYEHYVIPVLPVVYILSLMPDNLAEAYNYMDMFSYYIGVAATIVIPLSLFIFAIMKFKRQNR